MAGMMLEINDADKDEKLSREEWLAIARKVHDACEKEKDGTFNQKSLTAGLNKLMPPPEGQPAFFSMGGFMAGPIMSRADANKDGKLTSNELHTAAGAIFDEFDKAKSGKLDEDGLGEMLSKLFPVPRFGAPPPGPAK
jgi:hypothetical protein